MGHLVVLDDDPAELALCRTSLALWRECRHLAAGEYSPCGSLWIAAQLGELPSLRDKQARLQAAGVATQWLDGDELARIEPDLRRGLAAGLRVPSDAAVYAPRIAHALLHEACTQHGTRLEIGPTVRTLRSGAVLLADGRTIEAGALVVCAGLASGRLLPQLPFIARKGHLAITDRVPHRVRHQIVEIGYGASAHGAADSIAFNLQPRPTGQLLIGSCRQVGRDDRTVDHLMLGRMLQRASLFMPALARAPVLRAWTGVRPGTPDGRPYIGRWPLLRRVWVAAGHEGLGITTAFGSARLIVDQLLGRPGVPDAAPFDPARVFASGQVAA
jgi:glycine/D-amino acid oxidase-like deaminating enzyme